MYFYYSHSNFWQPFAVCVENKDDLSCPRPVKIGSVFKQLHFPGLWKCARYYCLTQWISKLLRSFEIHWVRQYLLNLVDFKLQAGTDPPNMQRHLESRTLSNVSRTAQYLYCMTTFLQNTYVNKLWISFCEFKVYSTTYTCLILVSIMIHFIPLRTAICCWTCIMYVSQWGDL